jgi:hypothetical protein
MYYEKYLKYKNKYLELKNQIGGATTIFIKLFAEQNSQIAQTVTLEYDSLKDLKLSDLINSIESKNITVTCPQTHVNININRKSIEPPFFISLKTKNTYRTEVFGTIIDNLLTDLNIENHSTILLKINMKLLCNPEDLEKDKKFKILEDLLQNIQNNRTPAVLQFFETKNIEELFEFLKTELNKRDFDKTILYYVARQGNIEILNYLIHKLDQNRIKELLKIRNSDGRTVLFGAVNAVSNKKQMYDLVKGLTDTSLFKATSFDNANKVHKNMKEWAEFRGMDKSNDPDERYIYDDVSKLVV